MQQWLVKTSLVLLSHNQHIALVVEDLLGLSLTDPVASSVPVHAALGVLRAIGLVWILDTTGKGNQDLDVIIVICLQVSFDLMVIANRRKSGGSDNHHLTLPADLVLCYVSEGLHDNGCLLLKVIGMQFFKAPDGLNGLCGGYFRVVRGILGNLEASFVCGVVLQHIQNKTFLNGLPHGVNVERVERAVRIFFPKHLQRFILWRSSEGEETQVFVLAVGDHLPHKPILGIFQFILRLALQLRILLEGIMGIRQGHFQLHGALPCLTAVGLVHNDGKGLAGGIIHLLVDDGELLQGGDNDPLAVVQSVPQVFGGLLFIDGYHGTQGVVKAGNGLLKLCIQHRAVGHDDHRVENGLVVIIVQAGESVGSPGNGIGLPGPGAVLYQIVFAGAIGSDILDQLPHHIHLVIPGEDDGLLGDLLLGAIFLGYFLFLYLEIDKLLDDVQ